MPCPPLTRRHVGRFITWAVVLTAIGTAAGQAQDVVRVRATVDADDGHSL